MSGEYETVNKRYPATESGDLLVEAGEGFIVIGNIMVAQVNEAGDPVGGLIGRVIPEPDENGKIRRDALLESTLTRLDLLRALYFKPQELRLFADELERQNESTHKIPGCALDWTPSSVAPDQRHKIEYIKKIVRAEYVRQIDTGMIPSALDYAHAIEQWLKTGEVPG